MSSEDSRRQRGGESAQRGMARGGRQRRGIGGGRSRWPAGPNGQRSSTLLIKLLPYGLLTPRAQPGGGRQQPGSRKGGTRPIGLKFLDSLLHQSSSDAAVRLGTLSPEQLDLLAERDDILIVAKVMSEAVAHADRSPGSRDVLAAFLHTLSDAPRFTNAVRTELQKLTLVTTPASPAIAARVLACSHLFLRCGRVLQSRALVLPLFELAQATRFCATVEATGAADATEQLGQAADEIEALLRRVMEVQTPAKSTQATSGAASASGGDANAGSARIPREYDHCELCPDVEAYRFIGDYPADEELQHPPMFLSQLAPEEPIYDFARHLEVHYRLLREDMVSELRDSVAAASAAIRRTSRSQGTRAGCFLLQNVRVVAPEFSNKSVGRPFVLLHLSDKDPAVKKTRWDAGKRLRFGSLVALSPRGTFLGDDVLWGTVVDRERVAKDHIVAVELRPCDFNHEAIRTALINTADVSFWLLESPVFFEAYRHTMHSLQRQRADDVPIFAELAGTFEAQESAATKIDGNSTEPLDVGPLYEADDGGQHRLMRLSKRHIARDGLPTELNGRRSALDESQRRACAMLLSQRVALVQGPPGTGKSFVGVRGGACVARSRIVQGRGSPRPLVVVTYTNHALDDYLAGVRQLMPENSILVRMGSRSQDPSLALLGFHEQRLALRQRPSGDQGDNHTVNMAFGEYKDAEREVEALVKQLQQTNVRLKAHSAGVPDRQLPQPSEVSRVLLEMEAMERETMSDEMVSDGLQGLDLYFHVIATEPGLESTPTDTGPETASHSGDEADEEEKARQHADIELLDMSASQDTPDHPKDDVREDAAAPTLNGIEDELMLQYGNAGAALQPAGAESGAAAGSAAPALNPNSASKSDPIANSPDERSGGWRVQRSRGRERANLKRMLAQPPMPESKTNRIVHLKGAKLRNALQRLPKHQRWALHNRLAMRVREWNIPSLTAALRQYARAKRGLESASAASRGRLLQRADIVAMTTTFAARNVELLEALGAEVLLVEEAAEVLESHVLALLTPKVRRILLIGDHQQLQPSTASHLVGTRMRLGVSLFERLVMRGYPHSQLTVQRRMRPALADVVRGEYDSLSDHVSTHDLATVQGLQDSLFFWDHGLSESVPPGNLGSVQNAGEANLVVALARYLLLQGYTTDQVVILTPYVGQLLLLRAQIRSSHAMRGVQLLRDVRVKTVDMFQGDEADIVLLSLVRSAKPGFLKVRNRALVALSRARQGLVVFGKASLLRSAGSLWVHALSSMTVANKITLQCARHPSDSWTAATAAELRDKSPEGGCRRMCGERLPCGHACDRLCHPTPHTPLDCVKPCTKELECGHHCKRLCRDPCRCVELVAVTLPCGHNARVECGTNPDEHHCNVPANVELSCGHTLRTTCFTSRNAALLHCKGTCGATLDCGHTCRGKCSECILTGMHPGCTHVCTRILVCGHECGQECSADCPPCSKPCARSCPHSNCNRSCGEPCVPCAEPCRRVCAHGACTRRCSEPCDRKPCDEPCPLSLSCGHSCIGLCGEPCPPKCRVCNQEAVTSIVFGNEDEEDARFVHLPACGHIVEVNAMDHWVGEVIATDSGGAVRALRCPLCRAPICGNCPRYHSELVGIERTLDAIRSRIIDTHDEIVNKMLHARHWAMQPPSVHSRELRQHSLPEQILQRANTHLRWIVCQLKNRSQNTRVIAEEAAAVSNLRSVAIGAAIALGASDAAQADATMRLIHRERHSLPLLAKAVDESHALSRAVFGRLLHRRAAPEAFRLGSVLFSWITVRCAAAFRFAEHQLVHRGEWYDALSYVEERASRVRDAIRTHDPSTELQTGWGNANTSDEADTRIQAAIGELHEESERSRLTLAARMRRRPFEELEIEQFQTAVTQAWEKIGEGALATFVRDVVAPVMGQGAGHWYRCPHGHLYVIGECGGAMEESRCPECGASIGGSSHRLTNGNTPAINIYARSSYQWVAPTR